MPDRARKLSFLLVLAALFAGPAASPSRGASPPEGSQGCASPRLAEGRYTQSRWPIGQNRQDGSPVSRTYTVHVPRQHADAGSPPLPLVLDLHGANVLSVPNWSQLHDDLISRMSAKGRTEGFIVVQPSASPFRSWARPDDEEVWRRGISDVQFIVRLLATLDQNLCFDRNRLFAAGISNGGDMASVLACAAARNGLGAHRIAAIAAVAMAPGHPWRPPSRPICPELAQAPVPTRIVISNNDKTLELLSPGDVAQLNVAVRTAAAVWARNNGCAEGSTSARTRRSGWGVLVETVTHHCANVADGRADTILDIFDTGTPLRDGHVWPDGFLAGEYRTTDAIWEFFRTHPR